MSDTPGSREGRYAARAARALGSPDEFFPEAEVDVPAPPMDPFLKQELSTTGEHVAEGEPSLAQEPLTTGEHVAEGATAPSAVLARHEALLQQLEESKAQLALLTYQPTASPNTQPTVPQTTRPAAAVPTETATRPAVSVGAAAAV